MKRRIFSTLAALALCLALLPATALAEETSIDMTLYGFVFANGIPIVIRENSGNGITSIYHAETNALLSGDTDVSSWAVYGGWFDGATHTANTSVVMESGTVPIIYGGSCTGVLDGSTNVEFKGGTVGWVYGGGAGCACTNTNVRITGQPDDYVSVFGGGYEGSVQTATLEFYGNGTAPNRQVMGVFGGGWNDTVEQVRIILGKDSAAEAVTFYANCPDPDCNSTVGSASFDVSLTHNEVYVNPRLYTLDGTGVTGTVSASFHGDGISATQIDAPTMVDVTQLAIDNCQFLLNGTESGGKRVLALDRLAIGPAGVAVFPEFNDEVTIGELAGSGKILFTKNFSNTDLTPITVTGSVSVTDQARMTIAYQGSEMEDTLADGFTPLQGSAIESLQDPSCFDVDLAGFMVVFENGKIVTKKESDTRKEAFILEPYRDRSSYTYGDTMTVTLGIAWWDVDNRQNVPIPGAAAEIVTNTIHHTVGSGETDEKGRAVIYVPVNDAVWESQSKGLGVLYRGDENYKPNNYGLATESDTTTMAFTVTPADIALAGKITAPSYDQVPNTALDVDPGAFYTAEVVWTPADTRFQAGVAYHAAIRLIPKPGYSLSSDRIGTITFNAETLTPAGALEPDGSLLLSDVAVFEPFVAPPSSGNSGGGGGGGSSGSGSDSTYAVTVAKPEHGTVTSNCISAFSGTTVTLTVIPDSGYVLDTLTVTDSRGREVKLTAQANGKYTFTMPGRTVTVTATFAPLQTVWNSPYRDVSGTAWYFDAVRYVSENGLMSGYGNGLFGPNDTLSRAQLAQILYNKEGRPVVNYRMQYGDVSGEAWYAEAVRWATSQGIVSGYGNGLFGPNDPVTREQLAVMLWRYAGSPAAANKKLQFTDADEISDYALEAMRWAVENGILNGGDGGRLDPQGQATRAQVAQMLQNYLGGK